MSSVRVVIQVKRGGSEIEVVEEMECAAIGTEAYWAERLADRAVKKTKVALEVKE